MYGPQTVNKPSHSRKNKDRADRIPLAGTIHAIH